MLDRLASRTAFWGALACLSVTGGVASLEDATAPAPSRAVARGFTSQARNTGGESPQGPSLTAVPLQAGFASLVDAAPLLSTVAFALALVGGLLLRRDTARRGGTERELRQQVRRLRDAMQASAEGVFLLRAIRRASGDIDDFEITDVNPTGARLLRATPQTLIGACLRRDMSGAVSDAVFEQYADAIALQAPLVGDVRVDPRRFAASWLLHQAVPTADGVAITIRDITERKREELRLRRASLTDHLTLLYNRRGFMTLAEQHLRIARRQEKDAVLLYVDMDDFKQLNDTYGHAAGDRALTAVGRLLRQTVRDCDVVARMGGDEFTIMALDANGAAARLIQRRIEERVAVLNATGELAAPLSLTIGYTRVRPTDDASITELLVRADQLLYARKRRRKLLVSATQRGSSRNATRLPVLHSAPLTSQAMHSSATLLPPELSAIARAAAAAGVPSTAGQPVMSRTQTA